MPPTRVVDVLAEVFRTYGFDTTTDAHLDGQGGSEHVVPLVVEKDGLSAAIAMHRTDGLLDVREVETHQHMANDVGADYAVLATTGGFTDAAYAHAVRSKAILWDRHDLEAVIGKAVLHEVVGDPEADIPIGEVLGYGRAVADDEEYVSQAVAPEPAAMEVPEAFGSLFGFDDGAPTEAAAATAVDETTEYEPLVMMDAMDMMTSADTRPEVPATEPNAALAAAFASAPIHTPVRPARTAQAQDAEHGRGWTLETREPRIDTMIDATNDPDPVPVPRTERPSIATMAAFGGLSRMPKNAGPDPRIFNPDEGALLAPIVSKEQAAGLVRDRIFTVDNTRLLYHPKRVYRWAVEAFVEGQIDTTTMTGVRVVDLATRRVDSPAAWSSSRSLREGTFDVPVDHKPVRIEQAKAQSLALDSILEDTAREITVEDFDASLDIMMTERRRVRTHRDDVKLEDDGLQWCPVWCFTGVNGDIEVDALSGAILNEQIRSTSSEAIML